ncbi:N-acetyltransferase [Flaviflexus salsibiostraticola]|uniref:N-acetyltransferase n=1 Tax=Flaviflexus salsibiostraticola TaxID=1282737 RepID=A0A3S8Z9C6_9ACTO|nr:GNAT family protein [Flaviflexus salsibiostraticola]AZN30130.1 N-acetyltransferase [Flaviflexus salsibiostraticola]
MTISLTRIDPAAERDALVSFMTANAFPFHVNARPTAEQVEELIAAGAYRDEDNDSYWIEHETHGRIGFFRYEDLTDMAPLFDLRLAESARGLGLAADILRVATDRIFRLMPEVNRFEGQTREDNVPMRRVFERCGWVQEAYYREGWPVDGAEPLASVAYSILRRDWQSGTATPISWEIPASS